MKKLVILLLIVTMAFGVGASLTYTEKAYAMELNNDAYDTIFLQSVEKLSEENYSGVINLYATKEIVYDINLTAIGYVYDFELNNESGYAIVGNKYGSVELIELFFDSNNPYSNISTAKRIYIGNLFYIYFENDKYYNAETNMEMPNSIVDELKSSSYYSEGGTLTQSSETLNYTYKNENIYNMVNRHPALIEVTGLSNACAPIAGGAIVQYWDRYSTDLIAGYTPGVKIGTKYSYKEVSTTLNDVVSDLYVDMETNVSGTGSTIAQFKTGLSDYCLREGNYSVVYSSCMVSGTFNYTTAKQYITNGQPVVLFLSTYTIAEITNNETTNSDVISYLSGSGNHAMVGFGYNDITYTLQNGTTRVDNYIAVSSGNVARKRGYFNIAYNTQIDDAYGVSIS